MPTAEQLRALRDYFESSEESGGEPAYFTLHLPSELPPGVSLTSIDKELEQFYHPFPGGNNWKKQETSTYFSHGWDKGTRRRRKPKPPKESLWPLHLLLN